MSEPSTQLNVLWAPWRFTYLEKPSSKSGKCIFVEMPEEMNDEKNLILHRAKFCFVMLNAYPYASGHLMVVPFQHTAEIEDLPNEALLEINLMVGRAITWLREAYHPEGFNVGVNLGKAAGAGIDDHIHWHVVPRWSGDTNFMTSVGATRVIPQSLPDAYQKLKIAKEKAGLAR